MNPTLTLGDCLDVLRVMPDDSVDSIVTDPPYGMKFMGRAWDYDVPTVEVWAECLRVLKPGGHMLAFSSARTYHRLAVRVEDAGFEIRDQLMWLYGAGFPKSMDCGCGWGTALKPAHEPIVMARKPFKGTVKANRERWGTAAINVQDCRIGSHKRWPANVLHDGSDEVVCRFPVTQSGSGNFKKETGADKHGNRGSAYGAESRPAGSEMISYGDKGSAARFFYCGKATSKDRNEGLPEGHKNQHPTVKPTDVMLWLCTLVTPASGVILDPFMGSGSTGKAALRGGFRFIGIDNDPASFETARSRIDYELEKQEPTS